MTALLSSGCRDIARFSSDDGHFHGSVVRGAFVRAGIHEDTRMCLTLDTTRLQEAPGTISTSDGRFRGTPLRSIPQIWHDPLSTLSFGDGRVQNLVYAVAPLPGDAGPAEAQDAMVIISLMQTDYVEVRLLRGAPSGDEGVTSPGRASVLFGVFNLERQAGPCEF